MRLTLVSEDSRRSLFEFGAGKDWKVAKYLEIKSECVIGNHFHKKKDELFLIVSGTVKYRLDNVVSEAQAGDLIEVPANTEHAFTCSAGTIIICLATQLHDPNDDYS